MENPEIHGIEFDINPLRGPLGNFFDFEIRVENSKNSIVLIFITHPSAIYHS